MNLSLDLSFYFTIGEDIDIMWNGNPLTWLYEGKEYSSFWKPDKYFHNWPSEMIGQFPMRGYVDLCPNACSFGDLYLLRTALVYMIPISDSVQKQEWHYTGINDQFIGGFSKRLMLYDRIMLPGKYKLDEQAIYLFADSGFKIIEILFFHHYFPQFLL